MNTQSSFIEKYHDYNWIKIKHKDDPSKSYEERFKVLEQHHIEETTFLIEEVRKLASLLDSMK